MRDTIYCSCNVIKTKYTSGPTPDQMSKSTLKLGLVEPAECLRNLANDLGTGTRVLMAFGMLRLGLIGYQVDLQ